MEFSIFTKEVEIDGTTYKLRPLSGRFLPKLYAVISKIDLKEGEDVSNEEMMKMLDEANIVNLHFIALETFKKSYPDKNVDELDEWVSQNLLNLLGSLIEVNLNSKVKEE